MPKTKKGGFQKDGGFILDDSVLTVPTKKELEGAAKKGVKAKKGAK